MTVKYHLIYPEVKWVTAERLMIWGADAYENGEIEHLPTDAEEAALLLSDAGVITWDGQCSNT